jgi:hypothetical protein
LVGKTDRAVTTRDPNGRCSVPSRVSADQLTTDAAVRRRAKDVGATTDHGAPTHSLLNLQRQVGNAQVARLLAQRQVTPAELQAMRDPSLLQRVGSPEDEDDPVDQE